jgi:hypothetical protein
MGKNPKTPGKKFPFVNQARFPAVIRQLSAIFGHGKIGVFGHSWFAASCDATRQPSISIVLSLPALRGRLADQSSFRIAAVQ